MDAGTSGSTTHGADRYPLERFASTSLFAVFQEELELKSALLDSMLDGVLAHTLRGEIVYANEPACRMYGHTPDEFVNLEPWGWVPKSMLAQTDERIALIRERGGLVFESITPSANGHGPRHTEVHARIVTIPSHGEILVSVIRDITDRFTAAQEMRHLAFHDQLTGLPNRPHFEERLHAAIADADRHHDVVGVVFMDLDDFKPVNDSLGHACGDKVLKIVADRLAACVRDSDMVARMGGDEFICLFPRIAASVDLATIAEALVECVSAPIFVDGVELHLGASVGLAVYERGEATDELITRADHAMYRAKLNGWHGWEEFLREL